jgi:hypothetical protein
MKKLREVEGRALSWHQSPANKGAWELRVGDDVVGTVAWQNPTVDGTLAVAASADGRWSFKRVGVFSPTVTVRVEGTNTTTATVTPHFGKSIATFADGGVMHFARTNFWRDEFAFTDGQGQPLLEFKQKGTRVEVAPGADNMPNVALAALLGCYLLHLYFRDAEANASLILLMATTGA